MDIEVVQYRNIKKMFLSCEGLTDLSVSDTQWVKTHEWL